MKDKLLDKIQNKLKQDLYNLRIDINKQITGLNTLRINFSILRLIYKGYVIPKLCIKLIIINNGIIHINTLYIIKEFSINKDIFRTVSINGVVDKSKSYTREQILDYIIKNIISIIS